MFPDKEDHSVESGEEEDYYFMDDDWAADSPWVSLLDSKQAEKGRDLPEFI